MLQIVKQNAKLIVVTRRDLTPSYQSTQSLHAIAEFCLEHSDIANSWRKNSQYLTYLSVKDESELLFLIEKAHSRRIVISLFREPDIDNQITAIAMEPSDESRRLCRGIPCALKEIESSGQIDKNSYKQAEPLAMQGV